MVNCGSFKTVPTLTVDCGGFKRIYTLAKNNGEILKISSQFICPFEFDSRLHRIQIHGLLIVTVNCAIFRWLPKKMS